MRQDIIDMMRSELYDDKFCQNDFEKYDLESINKYDEPFLWLVRPSGTNIAHIGPTAMREFESSKPCRFAWYRDEFAPIMSIAYWNNEQGFKYFFYDGLNLLQIKAEEAKEIFSSIWCKELDRLMEQYPVECEMCNEPLELVMSDKTRELYNEVLGYADSIGDTTLRGCIDRLQHHMRNSTSHTINLYPDFAEKSFGFSECVDGRTVLAGGIIYSKYGEKESWSTHT